VTTQPPRLPSIPLLAVVASLLVLFSGLGPSTPLAWAAEPPPSSQELVLAGGCFWCLEHDLESLPGVLDVESGYSGGTLARPSYRQVSAGGTGHQESVRVRFDPRRTSSEVLLRAYWRNIDPFDGDGQFCDRGDSYRPVIFTASSEQERLALASRRQAAGELGQSPAALKVDIKPLSRFWPAEDYHQNYADRNPLRYGYYRWACGRDRRLDAVWGARARTARSWGAPLGSSPTRG
jgi:peptide-methionine (S)-S-oxide reductase